MTHSGANLKTSLEICPQLEHHEGLHNQTQYLLMIAKTNELLYQSFQFLLLQTKNHLPPTFQQHPRLNYVGKSFLLLFLFFNKTFFSKMAVDFDFCLILSFLSTMKKLFDGIQLLTSTSTQQEITMEQMAKSRLRVLQSLEAELAPKMWALADPC